MVSESIKHQINFRLGFHFRILVAECEYYDLGLTPHSQKLSTMLVEAALQGDEIELVAVNMAKRMIF